MRNRRIKEVIRAISKHVALFLTGYVFLKAPARRLIVALQDNGNSLNQLLSSFTDLQEAELDEYSCSVDDVCREPVLEEIVDDHGVDVMKDQMAEELDDGMFSYLTVHCRLLACLLVSLSLFKVA
jgi:hypothetical protein